MENEIKDLPAIEPLCTDLWMFFYDNYGLTLLQDELAEIIEQVKKEINGNTTEL